MIDVKAYRSQMHAHLTQFVACGQDEYAISAADWYEANQPDILDGLGRRIRRDIERGLAEKDGGVK